MFASLSRATGSQLLGVLGRFRRELWAMAVFSAVINLLMLSPTLYMLQVFDRVLISRSELTLYTLTGFVLFFFVVQAFSEWMRSRLIISTGLRLDAELGDPVFHAVFTERLRNAGGSPVQAFADLNVIRRWLTSQGVFAFFDLPWSPIYLGVMFMLHPLLGVLTIVFMVLLAAFAWWTTVATRELSDVAEEEERELNTFVHTKLRNAEVIEAHGMVPNLQNRWWRHQVDVLATEARALELEERFSVSSKELRTLMQSLALGAGALLAIEGELSFGAMIAASLLMGRATSPIDQIVGGWKSFSNVRKSFQRIEALLAADTSSGTVDPGAVPGIAVSLRDVVATAPGRSEPILNGITADFPAGQVYAVLGNSGAGKSTLGKVLMGIWSHVQGDVMLNGEPIAGFDRDRLGPLLGYLPQDIELFGGTVAENIARMGEPDTEAVIDAANLTGTHDLILRMPKGYDSQIGEGGAYLSGGQRQRVALARAFYGSPRLIVLDEPNANLDDAGEDALCRAVLAMKERGATVFLITHRPGVVRVADQILVMSAGRIDLYGDRASVKAALKARSQPAPAAVESDSDNTPVELAPPAASAGLA
jgi:ATP-binding cassette subfamily C exporter for protease/lipase